MKEGEHKVKPGYAHFCEISGLKYQEGLEKPELFLKSSNSHLQPDEEPLEKVMAEDA